MRTLVLTALAAALIAADAKKSGHPDINGRKLTIVLLDKGKQVGTFDAAFADGQMTSDWIQKNGFASPIAMGKPTFDGSSNKRTSYAIDTTNAKGQRLTMSFTLYDARNGGGLSGQLTIIAGEGQAKTYAISADKVITK